MKNQQEVYMKAYIDNVEITRKKYKQEGKNKIDRFYTDLFSYLESAFFLFEKEEIVKTASPSELKEMWTKFN